MKWEKYWKNHDNMVDDKKLQEMKHPFYKNRNESINMRNTKVAPKHKNFSRDPSLNWQIQKVICVHNVGYEVFF